MDSWQPFTVNMGSYSNQLDGLGEGLGTFLVATGEPVGNFILLISIIGGITSIFMGIAVVIKKAIAN